MALAEKFLVHKMNFYKRRNGDYFPVFPGKPHSIKRTSRQGKEHRWFAIRGSAPPHPPAGHSDTMRISGRWAEPTLRVVSSTELFYPSGCPRRGGSFLVALCQR